MRKACCTAVSSADSNCSGFKTLWDLKPYDTCPPNYDYNHKNPWDSLLTKFFFIGISLMIKYFTIDWNNSSLKEKIISFIVYKTLPQKKLQESNGFLTFSGCNCNRNGWKINS